MSVAEVRRVRRKQAAVYFYVNTCEKSMAVAGFRIFFLVGKRTEIGGDRVSYTPCLFGRHRVAAHAGKGFHGFSLGCYTYLSTEVVESTRALEFGLVQVGEFTWPVRRNSAGVCPVQPRKARIKLFSF